MYLEAPHVFVAREPAGILHRARASPTGWDLTEPLAYRPPTCPASTRCGRCSRRPTARPSTRSTCSAGWCPPHRT
jgi:hypothetical protein